MGKIPKKIVDKIELRNMLDEEIEKWFEENKDIDGCDTKYATITDYHKGSEQGTKKAKEWCVQHCVYEDCYVGEYYWETAYDDKYVRMYFEV